MLILVLNEPRISDAIFAANIRGKEEHRKERRARRNSKFEWKVAAMRGGVVKTERERKCRERGRQEEESAQGE